MSSKAPDTSKASKISADASVQAANIQAKSEAENRALQERLFNQQQGYLQEQDVYNKGITAQNQSNYKPYIEQGTQALGSLSGAVNDPTSWLNKSFTQQDMQQDDGYQFRLDQGQEALNKSLASQSGLLSGAALKATSNYNQGMASDEYNNAYTRFTNDRNNRYSTLANLAGMGMQGATGFAGGSPASNTGTQLSNVAGQYGSNLGSIIQNGANNQSNTVLSNAKNQAQLALSASQGGGMGGAMTGALSGAATGASIGSVVPGIGTAFGAIGGAIVGGLGSLL